MLFTNLDTLYPLYRASKKYLLRNIAGESVLVSVGDGVADFRGIVTLNESAALLWKTLQNGATKEDLVKVFTEQFDVSEETASEDVESTLSMLKERGMIDTGAVR